MFGSRNPRPDPQRQPPSQQSSRGPYSRVPPDGSDRSGGGSYGRAPVGNERPYYDDAASEKQEYSRGQARHGSGGQTWQLTPTKSPGPQFFYSNIVAVSPFDFPPSRGGGDFYLLCNDIYVMVCTNYNGVLHLSPVCCS